MRDGREVVVFLALYKLVVLLLQDLVIPWEEVRGFSLLKLVTYCFSIMSSWLR